MIETRPAVSVAGSAVSLGMVPPGPCTVVITNAGATTLFVGAGPSGGTVSTSTGTPIPASAVVPLPGYPGSSAVSLYGITAGGTVTAGVFISTGF